MAGLTDNFGLTFLEPGDALGANGYSFINDNIKKVDRLLAAGLTHDHTDVSSGVADPTLAPGLTLQTTSGNLPAGTTIYYRYTWVDQYGQETASSPVASVSTAAVVAEPAAPVASTATVGGSLLGGTYNYALSAYVTTNTNETPIGARQSVSVPFTVGTNENVLTLPSLPSGATGFNIYRRAPGEAFFSYLASTTGSTYDDDGATTPNYSRQPQITNTTNSTNRVFIELPEALPANATWKIYRTFVNGNWERSNIKHVVEETFVGSGVIVDDFTDLNFGAGLETAPTTTEIGSVPGQISNDEVDFAYIPWTPTITGWAEGNATVTAEYAQLGKLVFIKFDLTYGSTTTSAAPIVVTLPVTAAAAGWAGMNAVLIDDSASQTSPAFVELDATTTFTIRPMSGVNTLDAGIDDGVPWTWATADSVSASFMYEAA